MAEKGAYVHGGCVSAVTPSQTAWTLGFFDVFAVTTAVTCVGGGVTKPGKTG